MSTHLLLKNKRYATLFSEYAPTLRTEPVEKDVFYSELCSFLQSTPADDKVIILCDYNARVGQDADSWKGVLGRHGVGNCNDNEHLLLDLCTERQIVITNAIFQQKDWLKTTWMHPRSSYRHLIDYVLVDKHDLIHTKVIPSAECRIDHRLVRCKLRLHFKPRPRKGGPTPRKSSIWTNFSQQKWKLTFRQLENSDCPEDTSSETLWDQLKSAILQPSEEVLGFTTMKNKDWFDESNQEIHELLAKKRSSNKAYLAQPSCPERRVAFCLICSILQCKLREIQNEWWTNLAKRTQRYAELGDYRGFYKALKSVYGLTNQVQSALRSAGGKRF